MIYLSKSDVLFINRATISAHGGNFSQPNNLLHEENLDYLLEAVEAEMFGAPLYPDIGDKAAVYCHHIVCNHVFMDGNKRTGLEAGLAFLKLNGFRLRKDIIHDDLLHFILRLASGQVSLEECRKWFADHIVMAG